MNKNPVLSTKQLKNIVSEVYTEQNEDNLLLTEGAGSFNWSKLLKYSLSLAGGAGALYNLSKEDSQVEKMGRWMTNTLGFPTSTEAAEALGTEMGAFWVHSLSKFDLAGGDQDYKEIEQQQSIQSNRPAMRYSIRMFDMKKDAIGSAKQLNSLTGKGAALKNPNLKYISEIGGNSKLVSMIDSSKKRLFKELQKVYAYAVKKELYKQDKIDKVKEFEYGGKSKSLLINSDEEVILNLWDYSIWNSQPTTVKNSIKNIIEELDFAAVDSGFRKPGEEKKKIKSIDLGVLDKKGNRETLSDFGILFSASTFLEYAFSKEIRKGTQKPSAEMPTKIMKRIGGFGDLYEALLIRAIPPLKVLFYKYAEKEGFFQDGKLQFNAVYENPFTDGVVQSEVLSEIEVESKQLFGDQSRPEVDYFVVNKAIANKEEIKNRHELAMQAAAQTALEVGAVLLLGPLFEKFGALVKASAWASRAPVISKMLTFSIAAMGIGTEIGLAVGVSKVMGDAVNKFTVIVEDLQAVSNEFLEEVVKNPAIVQDLMASYEDPEMAKKAEEALAIVEEFEKKAIESISNIEKLQSYVTNKVYEIIKSQAQATGVGSDNLNSRIGLGAGEGRFDEFEFNQEETANSSKQFVEWHKNPNSKNKKNIMNFFDMYISISEVLDKSAKTMRAGQQEMAGHLKALPSSISASKTKVAVNESPLGTAAKVAGGLAVTNIASELLHAFGPRGIKDITSILQFERYMLSVFNMPQQFTTEYRAKDVINAPFFDEKNLKQYLDEKLKFTKSIQKTYTRKFRERHAAVKAATPDKAAATGAYLFRPHIITIFDADALPNWNHGTITFSFEFYKMNGVGTMSASKDAYRRFYLQQFKQDKLIDEFLKTLDISQKVLSKVLISLYANVSLSTDLKNLSKANQTPISTSGGMPVINISQQDSKNIQNKIASTTDEQAVKYLNSLPEGSENKNRFLTVNGLRKLMLDCINKINIHRDDHSNLVNSAARAAQSLDKLIEFLVIMGR